MPTNPSTYPQRIAPGLYRVHDEVHAIRTAFLGGLALFETYALLLRRAEPFGLLLVDTGGPGSGRLICEALATLGYSVDDLEAVALTHWHGDHTGGLAEIAAMRSAGKAPLEVFVGQADLPMMLSRMPHLIRWHFLPLLHQAGRVPPLDRVHLNALQPDMAGDPLAAWGMQFLPTPGHTPGHTAYLYRRAGILFAGCALIPVTRRTMGLVPVYWDRHRQRRSAALLAGLECTTILPTHFVLKGGRMPLAVRREPRGLSAALLKGLGFTPVFTVSGS